MNDLVSASASVSVSVSLSTPADFGHNDPIFALASSPARAALHIYRLSGQGTWTLLSSLLRAARPPHLSLSLRDIEARKAKYALVCETDGAEIDDVIVTFFAAGSSYTGEESAEFTSHGNPLIGAQLQSLLRRSGFRDALPGEFTQRAFANGKLDLLQVEAISALIQCETQGALRLARQAASGAIAEAIRPVRGALLEARTELEARIDFSEDEVGQLPWNRVRHFCEDAERHLAALERSFERGRMVSDGLGIVLVGAPNAGKSSLYNALLQEERAIVSEHKGTTRDVLRERLQIKGRDFVLLDTAGLHPSLDQLEVMGMARTIAATKDAAILVLTVDLSDAESLQQIQTAQAENLLLQLLGNETSASKNSPAGSRAMLIALTKSDLVTQQSAIQYAEDTNRVTGIRCVVCSSKNVACLEEALTEIYDILVGKPESLADHTGAADSSKQLHATLITARQRDAVAEARKHLIRALEACRDDGSMPELVASDLVACELALGELSGRISPDEIFGQIFSSFCVGK